MATQTEITDQPAGTGLRRVLGTRGAAAFVITNMVGTGIFTIPAFVKTATGSGITALAVWTVGALLALCGALCYAELAARMPEAGGEYHFLSRIYGRMVGFLSGWISFLVGFSAAIAAASLGSVAYFSTVIPGWNPDAIFAGRITQGGVAAGILITVLAVFHTAGIRSSGRLQTFMTATLLGSIAVLIFAGVLSGRGDWAGVINSAPPQGSWWVALIQVSFAYAGWNAAAYLAGEVSNPGRTLPRALIGGTLTVGIIYLALNLLFFYALPEAEWQPTIAVGKLAAERLFGASGAQIVSGIIALMITGSVSAMTAAGPRVYFAMARDGLAPKIFGRLTRKGHAPVVAIIAQAIAAVTLALTGEFATLLTYVGSALLLFNGLTVAGIFFIKRDSDPPGKKIFRTPGYPFTPAIFLMLVALSWLYALRESPGPAGAALLTIAAGIGIYYLSRLMGWITGPSAQETDTHPTETL